MRRKAPVRFSGEGVAATPLPYPTGRDIPMGKGTYRLASGREVFISRFYADCTYSGVLEGGPEAASPHILSSIREDVPRVLPPGKPLVVVNPESMPLPPYRLVVELESRRGTKTTDPDFNSRLFVCWFADSLSPGVDALIRSVLGSVDWEAHAEDYDIMDF
jgi:hypothetical protein